MGHILRDFWLTTRLLIFFLSLFYGKKNIKKICNFYKLSRENWFVKKSIFLEPFLQSPSKTSKQTNRNKQAHTHTHKHTEKCKTTDKLCQGLVLRSRGVFRTLSNIKYHRCIWQRYKCAFEICCLTRRWQNKKYLEGVERYSNC